MGISVKHIARVIGGATTQRPGAISGNKVK